MHLDDAVCLRQGVLHLLEALVHVAREPVGAAQVTGEGEGSAELGHGHSWCDSVTSHGVTVGVSCVLPCPIRSNTVT